MSNEVAQNQTNESSVSPIVPRKRKKRKWLIILVLILVLAAIIFFFRRPIYTFLSNVLKDVPVVGQLFKQEGEDEEVVLSTEELLDKISSLETEMGKLEASNSTLVNEKEALQDRVENLKQYEALYSDFTEQKAKWDEEIANTNPQLFIEQFEATYPEVAERIYRTLKGMSVLNSKQKELSKSISEMDEEQAAKALEVLIPTDPELVKTIFEGMTIDAKSLILSSMTTDGAAQVIKLISPEDIEVQ